MAGPGEAAAEPWDYGRVMERHAVSIRPIIAAAALARIEERGGLMATKQIPEHKAAERAMWALGDYHAFAKATVWEVGPKLVAACGIGPGHRVLDVAAGTGNVAIRAAEAGAQVVASDLTSENFASGRREAEKRGVELQWVEADAEALPFADGEFDIVTSSFGAIFAPNHQAVADELLRVCRHGGTIGMANFTPDGPAKEFFETLAQFLPPPPRGAQSPLEWGNQQHVRELFGDRVSSLALTRETYVERSPDGPEAYVELFKRTFGPVIALYGALADQPERKAELDARFREFAAQANRGAPGGAAEYPYEYLQVVATKR